MIPGLRLDARGHHELVEQARAQLALACPELSARRRRRPGGDADRAVLVDDRAGDRAARAGARQAPLALLEILGVQLDGPAAARTGIRMRLSAPATEPLAIRRRHRGRDAAHSQPGVDRVHHPARLHDPAAAAGRLRRPARRGGQGDRRADGVAYPPGREQLPFSSPPQAGDALYLGFENSIGSLLLRVSIEASTARGAGVKPEDPPLRWEAVRARASGARSRCSRT